MASSAAASRDAEKGPRPWLTSYPPGIDWHRPPPTAPLSSLMDEAAARFAERPCLDFLGKVCSFAEIGRLVDRAAKGFQQLGVGPGVKVGLCLPNCPYAVVCFYGVLKAGGTVVNYNPLNVEREIAAQIEDSETDIMVTLDLRQLYPKVAATLETTRLKRIVVCRMSDALPPVKGVLFPLLKRSDIAIIPADVINVPFTALTCNDGKPRPVQINPASDIAVLQYTGGTTGTPKGAMLTHANLSANTAQVRSWFPDVVEGEERVLAVLPLFHVFGMTVAMNFAVATGAELILLPRFDLGQVLSAIARKRPTLFPGVPTMYRAIAAVRDIARHDLSSIKACISGGAPLPVEVKRGFEKLTGCVLVEGYGLTEASPVTHCNPLAGVNKDGSIGLPLPGTHCELRSLDDPTRPVGPGEKGELCVCGPQVMAGYWQRPEETGRVLSNGWLRTGDVGTIDDDGYVFLIDRIKDVILCSGYNVYPRMIEEAIYQHPAVAAVTVIGIPDDYRGQAPKAFIQLRDGHGATEDEIKDFLRDRLSPIEMPHSIEFRPDLPKTLIGKLSKKELVAEEEVRRQSKQ
jgi:long-chain acyl-CoA synthetase